MKWRHLKNMGKTNDHGHQSREPPAPAVWSAVVQTFFQPFFPVLSLVAAETSLHSFTPNIRARVVHAWDPGRQFSGAAGKEAADTHTLTGLRMIASLLSSQFHTTNINAATLANDE